MILRWSSLLSLSSGLLIGGAYNSLIRRRNEVDNAWSQIDVQLKRRLDLIPNLVETVKGYAAHEKTALEAVISARNSAMAASSDPHAKLLQTML